MKSPSISSALGLAVNLGSRLFQELPCLVSLRKTMRSQDRHRCIDHFGDEVVYGIQPVGLIWTAQPNNMSPHGTEPMSNVKRLAECGGASEG
jgi:hypothetical protein